MKQINRREIYLFNNFLPDTLNSLLTVLPKNLTNLKKNFCLSPKLLDCVFLQQPSVFPQSFSDHICFWFEKLAKIFFAKGPGFFYNSSKTCKMLVFLLEKSLLADNVPRKTLHVVSTTCLKASPKVRGKIDVCKNYKSTQF